MGIVRLLVSCAGKTALFALGVGAIGLAVVAVRQNLDGYRINQENPPGTVFGCRAAKVDPYDPPAKIYQYTMDNFILRFDAERYRNSLEFIDLRSKESVTLRTNYRNLHLQQNLYIRESGQLPLDRLIEVRHVQNLVSFYAHDASGNYLCEATSAFSR